jgi:hypothetical protein
MSAAAGTLSREAEALLHRARCVAPEWVIADGQEDACRELGMAGLAWWKQTDPEGEGAWQMGGHTILTLYPEAR